MSLTFWVPLESRILTYFVRRAHEREFTGKIFGAKTAEHDTEGQGSTEMAGMGLETLFIDLPSLT